MAALTVLVDALASGEVEIVDLTQPLSDQTSLLKLPEPFTNTPGFKLHELSNYDDRGPAWYWNSFEGGEHIGTHFDAPIHWVTGKDGDDVAQVPPRRLVGPAVVIDRSADASDDPDYLLTVEDIRAFEAEHGAIPADSWLLYRTGWDARAEDQDAFLNANETGPHTPGFSIECAQWLAEESPFIGVGVAPTPAPRTPSTRPSRATASCWGPASTGSPSSPISPSSRRSARSSRRRR